MIRLQTATERDIPLINQLGRDAFYPTYMPFITEAQVDYMFHKMYDEKALRQQMQARGDIFIIAFDDEKALGFAAYQLNYNPAETKLHKLYVLPQVQSKGVGKCLMMGVEEQAREQGQNSLLLNVNRYNKAVGFYTYLGYSVFREDDIDIGNGFFMNDFEMKKCLR